MNFYKEQFLLVMQKHIEQMRTDGKTKFSTVEAIKEYKKSYHSDKTNAHDSLNANIGKFLKKHAAVLGIREIAAKQPCKDDDGKPTSTSVWEFI
jgi:hypothetical protein